MKRIGIIIQARMNSTRLPGKIMLPLGEGVILNQVISRCKQIKCVANIVVATTTNKIDDQIVAWCESKNVAFYREDEANVLQRYIKCAEAYRFTHIIRVTSDCPFIDYEVANAVIDYAYKQSKFDLISIKENWSRGLAIELVSLEALKKISAVTEEKMFLEHVTFYIYQKPEAFTHLIYEVEQERQYPQFRLTVDTLEDYKLCIKINEQFQNELVSCLDIFIYLRNNPNISNINSDYAGITAEMDAKRLR